VTDDPDSSAFIGKRQIHDRYGINSQELAEMARKGMPVVRFKSGYLYRTEDIEAAIKNLTKK
jgi:hypothetical protein